MCGLQFQRLSSLSSCWDMVHAGRHGTKEGAECKRSCILILQAGSYLRQVRFEHIWDLKAHPPVTHFLQQVHTYSKKAIPANNDTHYELMATNYKQLHEHTLLKSSWISSIHWPLNLEFSEKIFFNLFYETVYWLLEIRIPKKTCLFVNIYSQITEVVAEWRHISIKMSF